jgi:predicted RNA-binding protein with PIN domain
MEDVLFEFIGCREVTDDEYDLENVRVVFVWHDQTAKDYIEIFADEKGSQWGQPVHILKMNTQYLYSWMEDIQEDDEFVN